MGIVFGDAEGLHKHLLKFTARSGKPVTHDGDTYIIEHSQFGSYDLQAAFTAAVRDTTSDPRYDDEFTDELETAIEETPAVITDRDLHYHYNRREYVDTSDLHRAASNYHMYHVTLENGDRPFDYALPRAASREEAIADVFTLMHARRAGQNTFFQIRDPIGDVDEHDYPDEGLNLDEIKYALRDTTASLHGPSALRQPDPSLHTTRCLYEIYDEIGMRPKVRHVYGAFVDPTRPGYYEPDDADGRRLSRLTGRMMGSAMGANVDKAERWTSVDEPPLESLDSYEPHDA